MTGRLALALALAASACGAQEPPVVVNPGRIDAERLLSDVQFMASDSLEGRAVGTPGNAAARRHVVESMRSAGLETFGGSFERPFQYTGRDGRDRPGVNVVGYVPGRTRPDRYIVVTAHYDHVGVRGGLIYNGADDNASGTAALMGMASYLAAKPPVHSVILAALDAEEGGLRGARAFTADPPVPLEAIALNVNMDMISHADSLLYAVGTYHYPFLRRWLEPLRIDGVALRFGHDRPELGAGDWTGQSDHAAFHAQGIPFVYFGVEDHPDYHKPTDDFETINPEFFVAAAELILEAVLALDENLEAIDRARASAQ